jgi:hypothetical protein
MINSVQSESTISTRRPRIRGACHRAVFAPAVGSIRATDLRATSNLLRRFNLISPVQPSLQKYSASPHTQITSRTFRIPPHRGAYRDRHGRGAGCGGRGSVLRAKRLQGGFYESVSDTEHADERRCCGRRSRVVLTPRRWRQVCGGFIGPTGSDKTLIRKRRWQTSPVTGESTKEAVKTTACGNAG